MSRSRSYRDSYKQNGGESRSMMKSYADTKVTMVPATSETTNNNDFSHVENGTKQEGFELCEIKR